MKVLDSMWSLVIIGHLNNKRSIIMLVIFGFGFIIIIAVGLLAYFRGFSDGKLAGSLEESLKYKDKITVVSKETVVD